MAAAQQFASSLLSVHERQGQTLLLSVLVCCRLESFSSRTFRLGERGGTDLVGVNGKMEAAHFLYLQA